MSNSLYKLLSFLLCFCLFEGSAFSMRKNGSDQSISDIENATVNELALYEEIFNSLRTLYDEGQLTLSDYNANLNIINALKFLHEYNSLISEEIAQSNNGHSSTYDQLHPFALHGTGDVPFPLKAGLLFRTLLEAFNFAKEHRLLTDMFQNGLPLSNGCLENRIDGGLREWLTKKKEAFARRQALCADKQNKASLQTSEEMVYSYIKSQMTKFSSMSVKKAISDIVNYYLEVLDCNGNPITTEIASKYYKDIFLLDETPEDSELIEANLISYETIERVEVNGQIRRCSLRETSKGANSAFLALSPEGKGLSTKNKKPIRRVDFVRDIRRTLNQKKDISAHFISLFQSAMRESGTNNPNLFLQRLSSDAYRMNRTLLQIYAHLYNLRINIYVVDHQANIFTLRESMGVGGQSINIAHVSSQPIGNMNNENLDHYVGLNIHEDALASDLAPMGLYIHKNDSAPNDTDMKRVDFLEKYDSEFKNENNVLKNYPDSINNFVIKTAISYLFIRSLDKKYLEI